ncbi:MAG: ABC transporter substrate-binding protein [Bryobacteraceae bacterium]
MLVRIEVTIFLAISLRVLPLSMLAGSQFETNLRSGDAFQVDDSLVVKPMDGRRGGTIVISERSEPRTFNPLTAIDGTSRNIVGLLMADLIHIDRYTQQSEAALAASWNVSSDGKEYTLHLRHGLRFSDGHSFDADDVLFTFEAYLDERNHSPQRDLLVIAGQPIRVRKVDSYTVAFTLPQPYAAAERLFDSIAILPRHLLKTSFDNGTLATAWGLNTPPSQIAGLGPFRVKAYVPGQSLQLERNPYYWKKDVRGNRLPYLDEINALFVSSADIEAIRFGAGEFDVIDRLSAANFSVLEKEQQQRAFHLYDLGPGLEYNFLVFNLNDLPPDGSRSPISKSWFQQRAFRQAVSSAIDRASIVRLAYRGRAYPLSIQISPGNKLWLDRAIAPPSRSLEQSRQLLRQAGFSWRADQTLIDSRGNAVRFSIMHNSAKPEQAQMAVIIQQDLKELGIDVTLVPQEFRTLVDRIFTTYKYEAVIMALADGDSDPNSEMNVLSSNGNAHVWSLRTTEPPPPWQQEIDRLMQEQLTVLDYPRRKRLFDQVEELVWKNAPVVFLVSPHILVGAKDRIGNFHPAVLGNYTLWNAEELFIRQPQHLAGH